MGKKSERLDKSMHIIQTRAGLTIKELALLLGVSDMTVRRDLKVLQERGIVKNINGAIIYNPNTNRSNLIQLNINDPFASAKIKIGSYAASLIESDDIILLDSGSEPAILAQNIDLQTNITAICYSRNTLNHLCEKPNVNIVLSGGYYLSLIHI